MIHKNGILSYKNNDIKINSAELSSRLFTKIDFTNSLINECTEAIYKIADCKAVYLMCDVDLTEDNICDFGFVKFKSKNL